MLYMCAVDARLSACTAAGSVYEGIRFTGGAEGVTVSALTSGYRILFGRQNSRPGGRSYMCTMMYSVQTHAYALVIDCGAKWLSSIIFCEAGRRYAADHVLRFRYLRPISVSVNSRLLRILM